MKLPSQVQTLVDGKNYAHIATVLASGAPHVVPVWIDRDDDMILVNTTIHRQKTKNVTRDPRVAISIYAQDDPFNWAMIRGKVGERTQNGAEAHIHKLAKKYLNQETFSSSNLQERVILKITPTHIITPRQFR